MISGVPQGFRFCYFSVLTNYTTSLQSTLQPDETYACLRAFNLQSKQKIPFLVSTRFSIGSFAVLTNDFNTTSL